jgi:hypothetical protein
MRRFNMITEERKDRAAKINGFEKERYEDRVRASVREEMFPEDELAIHRKAIVELASMIDELIDIIAILHPEEITKLDLSEFMKYNAHIESIKENIKNVRP